MTKWSGEVVVRTMRGTTICIRILYVLYIPYILPPRDLMGITGPGKTKQCSSPGKTQHAEMLYCV